MNKFILVCLLVLGGCKIPPPTKPLPPEQPIVITANSINCVDTTGTSLGSTKTIPRRVLSPKWTADYDNFDETYFDGKLPYIQVYSGPAIDHDEENLGITNGVSEGYYDPNILYIEINPDLNNSEGPADMTLLHEMCHVYVKGRDNQDHGRRWQGCMHRLANEGAFDDLW